MKGQYFSFDAIIASVIFVLALVALLSYWHSVRSFLDFQDDALSKDAIRVSTLLFSPASPSMPDCKDIERLGFAVSWSDRRVNQSLIDCAEGKDPLWLKEKLGTSNDLTIRVENLADGTVNEIGTEIQDATDVVKIRRLATVLDENGNTHLATIDISIYKIKK